VAKGATSTNSDKTSISDDTSASVKDGAHI